MFKKTEETEWTRFSKALSGRERDEAEEASDDEPKPAVASTSTVTRTETPAPVQVARQSSSDVNVSSRPVSRPAAQTSEDEIESTIGQHTTVDGTFKSDNSIRIRGTVQGEIESQRAIFVEGEANVTAKVTAETVTVAGQVNGQIYCAGRVEIRPSGRVIGEIHAGTLIMQEGAFFEGHLKMGNRGQGVEVETAEGAASR
jgi:cytoskeletal protein CcmA (bactofilin family)